MPDYENIISYFNDDLNKIEIDLIKRIQATLKSGASDIELAQLYAEINLYNELTDLGFESSLNKYFDNYDEIAAQIISDARSKGVNLTGVNAAELDLIKGLDYEYLQGKTNIWGLQLQSSILKGLITGKDRKELVKELQGYPLRDYQMDVAIRTGYTEFNALTTAKIYESRPGQRFRLEGPKDIRTRPSCNAVLKYQPKEGWTLEEIKTGAATKLVQKHANEFAKNKSELKQALETNYDFVHRAGFNCRHLFESI